MTGTDRPVADLRLVPAAATAWAVTWLATGGLLPGSPSVTPFVAAAGIALVLLAGGPLPGRRQRLPGSVLLAGAAVVVALSCTGLVLAERQTGPVPGWVAGRAAATVSGQLRQEPQPVPAGQFGGPPRWVVTLSGVTVRARGREVGTAAPVAVLGTSARWGEVPAGSRVRVGGRFTPTRGPAAEVGLLVSSQDPQVTPGGPAWRASDRLRAGLRAAATGRGPDADGLLPALAVGDVSGLPADLKAAMQATGLSHLTAVSGANLTIVAGSAVWLTAVLGGGRAVRVLVAAAAIGGFVVLARPQPSVLRAAVMAAIGLAALVRGRPGRGLPAVAGCVLVLLCVDPWLCRSYGFALSVCATTGLVLLAPPLAQRWSRRMPRWAAVALAVPVAAEAFTAPVAVLLRPAVGLVSLPANLLAAPAVGPATVLGVLAALVSPVHAGVAHLLAVPGLLATGWVAQVARHAAAVPHGSLPVPAGTATSVVLAAGSVLVTVLVLHGRPVLPQRLRAVPQLALRPAARPVVACLLVLAGFVAAGALGPVTGPGPLGALGLPLGRQAAWPPPGWRMVQCAVGQGDALVLSTGPGRAVLVDAGPEPDPVDRCLRRLGVHRLDLVVLTHQHSDHVAGLEGALRGRTVDRALVSPLGRPAGSADRSRRLLAAAGATVTTGWAGERGSAGAASPGRGGGQSRVDWQVLWPLPSDVPGQPIVVAEDGDRSLEDSAANDASVVLLVRSGGVTLLALGDLETAAQRLLLRTSPPGPVDVVKVSHHGSARQAPELYRALQPRAALVGVGPNSYGHPAPQTLAMLAGLGTVVLRTDRAGDVAVLGDGSGLAALARGG